jgi:ubiquinone/menaquinone biosynthesis C-methylase UbiE
MKKFLINKLNACYASGVKFIAQMIENYPYKNIKILDVGCGDGDIANRILSISGRDDINIYGIDVLEKCNNQKIIYSKLNLEGNHFPFNNEYFDIIYSNQVLEHIFVKDNFIKQCHRVLKSNGLVVIATENIASFDNIASLFFGQEPLVQHTSGRFYINSFLSPHFMKKNDATFGNTYGHRNVCSYFGLKRLLKINGFNDPKIQSYGHLCWLFEKIFPFQNRVIIAYAKKN